MSLRMAATKRFNKHHFLAGAALVSFFILTQSAFADVVGEQKSFYVNSDYDEFSREIVSATLRDVSEKAYFYIDDRFWAGLNQFERNNFLNNLNILGEEFDDNIYPKETEFWGSESKPGIDGDPKITVLAEDLIRGNGGYFETANLFSRKISPESNEREMVAISAEAISGLGKIFLAHEFQHLISFNQKELLQKSSEDVWFNELRSEYAGTLVGYNDIFQGSNLERRLSYFLDQPSDSLVEWPNVSLDYAHVALFAEYLAEQFGPGIISDTIKNPLTGIESINQYLAENQRAERFSDIFGDWLIANFLNNHVLDSRYGYQSNELSNFRVSPLQYSLVYPTNYQLDYDLKPWQGSWHKLNLFNMPADKALKFDFNGEDGFRVWYIDNLGSSGFLRDGGYLTKKDGLNYVVLMPVNESKIYGFGASEPTKTFRSIIDFIDVPVRPVLKNGDLIKRPNEQEIYVVEGKYKRYLNPEVIKLYGHLDSSTAVELDNETFNSFSTSNYVRYVDREEVYAVWPDGTKHWFNITPRQWDASGRDWGAIFIINDLELNTYKIGLKITK